MLYIYYYRDKFNKEHTLYVKEKDLIQHKENLLYNLADPDLYPVDIITGEKGCFRGYDSFDCFVNSEVSEDEEPDPELMAYIESCSVGIMVYGYPFALVRHTDGSYTVCSKDDVDIDALIEEYASNKDYKTIPCYYREDEITPEEAKKQGMYALADLLETREEDDLVDSLLEEEWGNTSPLISAVEEDSLIAENRPEYEDGESLPFIKKIVD